MLVAHLNLSDNGGGKRLATKKQRPPLDGFSSFVPLTRYLFHFPLPSASLQIHLLRVEVIALLIWCRHGNAISWRPKNIHPFPV